MTILLFLTACNQSSLTSIDNEFSNTLNQAKQNKDEQQKRLTFNKTLDIVADSSYSIWVAKQDSSFSLALHFQYKDTLSVSYSPECWLMYPYKLDGNKIVVYWDNNIDTKYNFELVKAINNIDKKIIGKPFMILELISDTAFKVTYPIKDLIKKLNNSSKERIFFPDTLYVVQAYQMYD